MKAAGSCANTFNVKTAMTIRPSLSFASFLLFLLCAIPAIAQDGGETDYPFDRETVVDESDTVKGPNLNIIGRSFGDSIVLRWGAGSYTAWKTAGRGGYVLERIEVSTLRRDQQPKWTRLNGEPIRPLTLEEWKSRYRPEDTLAGAAVQTLYGAAVVTETDPFGSIYETYLQQENMYGFAMLLADIAPRLADGYGLRFVDRNVQPGKNYLYRLYSLANDPEQPIDTAIVVVGATAFEPTPDVLSLSANEDEKLVVLKWYRYEHPQPFTGYFIERSTDGGKTFSRLKETPFIAAVDESVGTASDSITYRIELEQNYVPAHYRVVGVDPFGQTSQKSTVLFAMGRDRTAPKAPLIAPAEATKENGIRIRWELSPEMESDFNGFYVGRSLTEEGPFFAISERLSKDAREYIARNVDTLPPAYYVVGTVDTAGNLRNSVPVLGILPDSIAPAIPNGLAGSIDSNGVVVLTWNPNYETDLQGYRVFFANQEDHEFQQLTTDITTDTIFRDTLTLETLSETIYYKVTALDWNFNHSEFTKTLTLKKPDTVAPISPVITDVVPGEGGVRIEWYRSPSGDALEYRLYRRKADEESWGTLLTTKDPAISKYTDSLAERGTLYEYALDVRDDDGNRSDLSNIVTARPYESGLRSGVDDVVCRYDSTAGGMVVRWRYGVRGDARIYLYRGIDDREPSLLASVEGSTNEYIDREVYAGARYRYSLKVVTDDGGESVPVPTEVVEVR